MSDYDEEYEYDEDDYGCVVVRGWGSGRSGCGGRG
jgi:hypothetical protein